MTNKDIDTAVAQLQQVLDRDYAHREWRVLVGPLPSGADIDEPWVFVHGRTRDFRYRCRVGRSWSMVRAAPSLRLLVAELAADVEHCLADQAAAAP